jgi:nucleoside-diphosphate-sugar epimerase
MIFITGATGFLGSYLARSLVKQGYEIRALKRTHSSFELLGDCAGQIDWVEGDLLDLASIESALEGIDKIYHCAGVVATGKKAQQEAILINTTGTANLFNVALAKNIKKVVHVSSTMALGMPVNNYLIDETTYLPVAKSGSSYLESKRFGELEAWRASAEGLEVVIVNPAGLIGAGRWKHEPLNAIEAVDKGLKFYTGGANAFLDVRDAVEVMIWLMESKIAGERFILISENVTVKDLLDMIADELKVPRPKYKAGKILSSISWRYEGFKAFVTGREPLFNRDDMHIANLPFRYNNARIINTMGFKFRPVAISIHDTVQSYLESKQKGTDFAIFH